MGDCIDIRHNMEKDPLLSSSPHFFSFSPVLIWHFNQENHVVKNRKPIERKMENIWKPGRHLVWNRGKS